MGEDVDSRNFTRQDRQQYRGKVRRCLDVLAQMLAEARFDFERPLTGLEIEFNLIDADQDRFRSCIGICRAPGEMTDPSPQPVFGLERCAAKLDDPTTVDRFDLSGERKRVDSQIDQQRLVRLLAA